MLESYVDINLAPTAEQPIEAPMTIFGFSKDDLKNVDLFDSCTKPACCRS